MAKRAFAIVFFLILFIIPVYGKHIVGGQLTMQHTFGYRYLIRMNLFLDNNPNDIPLQTNWPSYIRGEEFILVSAYSNKTNTLVESFQLTRLSNTPVEYENLDCVQSEIKTNQFFYQAIVTLDPEKYSEEEGYYIIYQRCCRNKNISNTLVFGSDLYGQTFLLEFPAIVDKDGKRFKNSSPVFPQLKTDYACVNQAYFANYAATDKDGDELRYSMVTPLDVTDPSIPVPDPTPKPYKLLEFGADYSEETQITGNPGLLIDQTGVLRVTPDKIGLFVFGIKVEEYRNGKKIGEIRRDYQIHVLDCEDVNTAPVLTVEEENNTAVDINKPIIVAKDENKCLVVKVQDNDAPSQIKLKAIGLNFVGNLDSSFKKKELIINDKDEIGMTEFCLDFCSPLLGKQLNIGIIAFDNGCPIPKSDTVKFSVVIPKTENKKPAFKNTQKVTAIINEGDQWFYEFELQNEEGGDELSVEIVDSERNPDDLGLSLSIEERTGTSLKGRVSFDANCALYEFADLPVLKFSLKGTDDFLCPLNDPAILDFELNLDEINKYRLELVLDRNEQPFIISEGDDFRVLAKLFDLDNNVDLTLSISERDQVRYPFIIFPRVSGKNAIENELRIDYSCDIFTVKEPKEVEFEIIGEGVGSCSGDERQVVPVKMLINPPKNFIPILVSSQREDQKVIKIGKTTTISLVGIDQTNERMVLFLENREELSALNFSFEDKQGSGRVSSALIVNANCAFLDGASSREAVFRFRVIDDYCLGGAHAMKEVRILIEDIDSKKEAFLPPNVFTPNNDGLNDAFRMPTLPLDLCEDRFLSVTIYNRYGRKVYSSTDRNFQWRAENFSTGTYFYQISYTKMNFKGYLSLIK